MLRLAIAGATIYLLHLHRHRQANRIITVEETWMTRIEATFSWFASRLYSTKSTSTPRNEVPKVHWWRASSYGPRDHMLGLGIIKTHRMCKTFTCWIELSRSLF